jgi:hypothetical protein
MSQYNNDEINLRNLYNNINIPVNNSSFIYYSLLLSPLRNYSQFLSYSSSSSSSASSSTSCPTPSSLSLFSTYYVSNILSCSSITPHTSLRGIPSLLSSSNPYSSLSFSSFSSSHYSSSSNPIFFSTPSASSASPCLKSNYSYSKSLVLFLTKKRKKLRKEQKKKKIVLPNERKGGDVKLLLEEKNLNQSHFPNIYFFSLLHFYPKSFMNLNSSGNFVSLLNNIYSNFTFRSKSSFSIKASIFNSSIQSSIIFDKPSFVGFFFFFFFINIFKYVNVHLIKGNF